MLALPMSLKKLHGSRLSRLDLDVPQRSSSSGYRVLQQRRSSRGINRKPHDLVVVLDSGSLDCRLTRRGGVVSTVTAYGCTTRAS